MFRHEFSHPCTLWKVVGSTLIYNTVSNACNGGSNTAGSGNVPGTSGNCGGGAIYSYVAGNSSLLLSDSNLSYNSVQNIVNGGSMNTQGGSSEITYTCDYQLGNNGCSGCGGGAMWLLSEGFSAIHVSDCFTIYFVFFLS